MSIRNDFEKKYDCYEYQKFGILMEKLYQDECNLIDKMVQAYEKTINELDKK